MELIYGRFEVMAKMPEGKGTWPAIWFLSSLRTANVPGPPQRRGPDGKEVQGPPRGANSGESSQGEIDLMESWGSRPNRTAVHIHGTQGRTPSRTVPVEDIYNKFHLYAMEWYPDRPDEPAPDDSGGCIRRSNVLTKVSQQRLRDLIGGG